MTHKRNILVFISFYMKDCHFLLEGSIYFFFFYELFESNGTVDFYFWFNTKDIVCFWQNAKCFLVNPFKKKGGGG